MGFGERGEKPPHIHALTKLHPSFQGFTPGLSRGWSLRPPGLQVQVGDVPSTSHGCSAPLQPTRHSYLGDAAVSPQPRDVGVPHAAAATVPHSPTFQQRRRRRRTKRDAALSPNKRGQVGGAMAGGQEPGEEWEPGPAPSGSRENAGSAKPRAGFTTTTRPRGEMHLAAGGRHNPTG